MEKKTEALKNLYKNKSQSKMLEMNPHISVNTVDMNAIHQLNNDVSQTDLAEKY